MIAKRQFLCGGVFLGATLLLSGCGERPFPVEGIVTLDGQPVEGGSITFMPLEGGKGEKPSTGAIVKGGLFRMTTHNTKGAMKGKYKVVISKSRQYAGQHGLVEIKELLPPAYSNPNETVLRFEVEKGGKKEVRFDLKSDGSAPGS